MATKFAPAHSEKLADAIVEGLRGKDEYIRKYATAVMAPGMVCSSSASDLDAAFDPTERIDTNAYCILMSRLSAEGVSMDPESMRMRLRMRSGRSMIITLTPNTGIDFTSWLSSFQLNSTIRFLDLCLGDGRQSHGCIVDLGKWAFPRGRSVLPQDPTGLAWKRRCASGVETDFTWVDGETRLNTIIAVSEGQSTITSSTLKVAPEHVADFAARYQKALEGASCVVMGGSLPAACQWSFTQMPSRRHTSRVPVIFDPVDLLFPPESRVARM